MDEVLTNIHELIDWYRNNSAGANIYDLMDFQDRLGTYTSNLTDLYNKYSKGYNLSYIERKYTFAANRMKFKENNNGGDSDNLAEASVKRHRKQEVLNYEVAQRLQMMRQDCRQILSLCMQRISFLKMEYETSKIQK